MCRLTLLVEQLSGRATKMTTVTLRAGNCKLMKLWTDCEVGLGSSEIYLFKFFASR